MTTNDTLKEDEFLTISEPSDGQYKEKGSKFIALSFPVTSEDDAKKILAQVREQYHDARHHCFAYRIDPISDHTRANDDGEPSGTAGKPILGQIMSFNLTNILIIVIRYFGGTKLGVSGLINAYRTSAKDAIENAVIIKQTIDHSFTVTFPYENMNEIMKILKDEDAVQTNQEFDMICSIDFSVRMLRSEIVSGRINKVEKAILKQN